MRAQVDRFDWAAPPFGPVTTWPATLSLVVGVMLNSPEQVVVLRDLALVPATAQSAVADSAHLYIPAREVGVDAGIALAFAPPPWLPVDAAFRRLFVGLTGSGQQVDKDRSAAAGFAAHLVKPADIVLTTRHPPSA